ncbi:MAG: amidohydrolase family protein [Alphaproteobacteria bacterium]|nr:amidohydrolase family protein [Alphaproteobacteria bacterium]
MRTRSPAGFPSWLCGVAGALMLAASAGQAAPLDAAGADLAISGATVVSPERATPLENATVLVKDGRIVAVAAGPVKGAAAREIRAEGKYLVPGLIDSHVHLYHATGLKRRYTRDFDALHAAYMKQLPRSFLYYGYTTVIELNADAETNARFLSAPHHPRLRHCGQGLILHNGFMASEIPPGELAEQYPNYLHDSYGDAPLPKGAAAAQHTPQATVAAIAAAGGICVKMYYEEALWSPTGPPGHALPSEAIIRDVVAAAHARGMPVLLHATTPKGHRVGMAAGVDVLAHGLWEWPGVAYDDPHTPPEIADLVDREAAAGIGVQPTMRTLRNTASMFDPGSLEDPALDDVLPAPFIRYLKTDAQVQRQMFMTLFGSALKPGANADDIRRLQLAFNRRYETLIGRMDAHGAHLFFGTDTAVGGFGWGNPPGLNGYWEMLGWARGGVSPRTIFEAATIRNARMFHLDREIGTVEPGKRADLLLMNSNPLETLDAYASISTVILDGEVLSRASLSARAP